jgi:ABC-type nickel/cobalt efflux system permease component RcnA
MKKLLLICLVTLSHLAWVPTAAAHPLGNFTINCFSRVETAGNRIYVRYVLDLAEIPTFQLHGRGIDAQRIARGAVLVVDGRRTPLAPIAHTLAHPAGAGGLRTTRFEAILRGPRIDGRVAVEYRDTNYAGRIGWREIVVGNARSMSDELHAYPRNLLESPLAVTRVHARLAPNDASPPALSSGRSLRAPDRVADSGFASLVDDNLSPGVVLIALALAMFWGAAHALSPGHGKAIVAAYLVGTRGAARHAALLGLIVTVTHTLGVFTLGLVTLALSQFVVPDQLYPWLNLAAALLVVGVGVTVLRARVLHMDAHLHGHEHHHEHDHGGEYDGGLRGLIATGISGGILPCPSALVVLLAAISLHRVGYGLLLIVAFSLGLAVSITAIGLVAVSAKSFFSRASFEGRLVRALPTVSALIVIGLGIAMTLRALPKVS